jgi:hypothetical protein
MLAFSIRLANNDYWHRQKPSSNQSRIAFVREAMALMDRYGGWNKKRLH